MIMWGLRLTLVVLGVLINATTGAAGTLSPEVTCRSDILNLFNKDQNTVNLLPTNRFGHRGFYIYLPESAYFVALPEKVESEFKESAQLKVRIQKLETRIKKLERLSMDTSQAKKQYVALVKEQEFLWEKTYAIDEKFASTGINLSVKLPDKPTLQITYLFEDERASVKIDPQNKKADFTVLAQDALDEISSRTLHQDLNERIGNVSAKAATALPEEAAPSQAKLLKALQGACLSVRNPEVRETTATQITSIAISQNPERMDFNRAKSLPAF